IEPPTPDKAGAQTGGWPVSTFGTELSHQPSPADETSSFAAPDRSGCALIGRIFLYADRTMRPAHPKGESGANLHKPLVWNGMGSRTARGVRLGPPHSATDPGELQPDSGSRGRS